MSEAEIRGLIAQFLFEWIKWVEAGAEEPHFCFARNKGLCVCLKQYLSRSVLMSETRMYGVTQYFFNTLLSGDVTPFNRGNQKSYSADSREGTIPFNQARRIWAYGMLRELNRL